MALNKLRQEEAEQFGDPEVIDEIPLNTEETRILKDDGLKTTVTFQIFVPGSLAAEDAAYFGAYFIADRDYEFIGATFRFSGGAAGTATFQVVKNPSGSNFIGPSAGTSLMTNSFQVLTGPEVHQFATPNPDRKDNLIKKDEAVALRKDPAKTVVGLEGVCCTVRLRAL